MKRFFLSSVMLITFLGVIYGLGGSASAAIGQNEIKNAKLEWVNAATIRVTIDGQAFNFVDSNLSDNYGDGDFTWKPAEGRIDGCDASIKQDLDGNSSIVYKVDVDFRPGSTASCQDTNPNKYTFAGTALGSPQNKSIVAAFTDANTIQRVDGNNNWVYVKSPRDPNVYLRTAEENKKCQDRIVFDPASNTYSAYELMDNKGTDKAPAASGDPNCYITDSAKSGMNTNGKISVAPLGSAGAGTRAGVIGGSAAGSGSARDSNTCAAKGGTLSWIICPVIKLIDEGLQKIDEEIANLLEVKPREPQELANLRSAERRIRNLAYIILIPIMLVMVISTALGFEFISAYTVKKALPRLVVAIIFIALASQITTFLIDITNTVGAGISGLILDPFIGTSQVTLASLVTPTAGAGVSATAGLGIFGAFVVLGPAAIGIGLSYALVAFVVIFLAFAILAVRQVLIIVLALIAPLAILAWIFPGNDKLWKLWWSSFSKLLLMYPIIILLITSGKVFASFVKIGQPDGILATVVTITAYIAPYFFIPATFKLAGGVFATISGMANDRSRGLFDRQKKFRQGVAAERHAQNMDGTSNLGRGRLGSMYRRTASVGKNGSFSPSRGGRARWQQQEQKVAEKTADRLIEEGGARAFNDDDASSILRQSGISGNDFMNQYVNLGHSRDQARSALSRAELATGAKVGSRGMAVAAQKFRVANTNTAYATGPAGLAQMQNELMDTQAHGLATAHDVAGWMKSNRGRADYAAASFGETVSFAQGNTTAAEQISNAYRGADTRDIVGGHQRAVESFAAQAADNLQAAVGTGDQVGIDRALADVANVHSTLSGISANKGNEFANTVLSQGSGIQGQRRNAQGDVEDRELTVRELVEDARNDSAAHGAFHDRVREYSSARDAGQAGAAEEAIAPPPDLH